MPQFAITILGATLSLLHAVRLLPLRAREGGAPNLAKIGSGQWAVAFVALLQLRSTSAPHEGASPQARCARSGYGWTRHRPPSSTPTSVRAYGAGPRSCVLTRLLVGQSVRREHCARVTAHGSFNLSCDPPPAGGGVLLVVLPFCFPKNCRISAPGLPRFGHFLCLCSSNRRSNRSFPPLAL